SLLPEMLHKVDRWPIQACFWLEWEIPKQAPRHSLLQRLQRISQRAALQLAQQKMNMLRHYHITINTEFIIAAHPFQSRLERPAACVSSKHATAMIATESNKMTLAAVMETYESPRH